MKRSFFLALAAIVVAFGGITPANAQTASPLVPALPHFREAQQLLPLGFEPKFVRGDVLYGEDNYSELGDIGTSHIAVVYLDTAGAPQIGWEMDQPSHLLGVSPNGAYLVGTAEIDGERVGFVSSYDGLTWLPPSHTATAVNDHGVVAGFYQDATYPATFEYDTEQNRFTYLPFVGDEAAISAVAVLSDNTVVYRTAIGLTTWLPGVDQQLNVRVPGFLTDAVTGNGSIAVGTTQGTTTILRNGGLWHGPIGELDAVNATYIGGFKALPAGHGGYMNAAVLASARTRDVTLTPLAQLAARPAHGWSYTNVKLVGDTFIVATRFFQGDRHTPPYSQDVVLVPVSPRR